MVTVIRYLAIVVVVAVSLCPVDSSCLGLRRAAQLHASETITVTTRDGRQLRAKIDPRTSTDHLWLRYGSSGTVIRQRIAWNDVVDSRLGQQVVSSMQIQELAAAWDAHCLLPV